MVNWQLISQTIPKLITHLKTITLNLHKIIIEEWLTMTFVREKAED